MRVCIVTFLLLIGLPSRFGRKPLKFYIRSLSPKRDCSPFKTRRVVFSFNPVGSWDADIATKKRQLKPYQPSVLPTRQFVQQRVVRGKITHNTHPRAIFQRGGCERRAMCLGEVWTRRFHCVCPTGFGKSLLGNSSPQGVCCLRVLRTRNTL